MSEVDNDDFFEEGLGGESSPEMTKRISAAYEELMANEIQLEILNDQCKDLSSKISKSKRDILPDLLREMGTDIWRDQKTGTAIELEIAVNSSLPKDVSKRNELLDALRPIGIEEILGEEFNIVFLPRDPRTKVIRALFDLDVPDHVVEDDEEDASSALTNEQMDAVQQIREMFEWNEQSLPVDEKLGCNAARLKSWLKKRIEEGKGTEVTEAGIWHGKMAKIVKPKKAKS